MRDCSKHQKGLMYYLDKRDKMLCVECGKDDKDNILCNDLICMIKCHSCGKSIGQDNSIYVRKHTDGLWRFFRKIDARKYELHPDYLGYGFGSKSHAEKRARERS